MQTFSELPIHYYGNLDQTRYNCIRFENALGYVKVASQPPINCVVSNISEMCGTGTF